MALLFCVCNNRKLASRKIVLLFVELLGDAAAANIKRESVGKYVIYSMYLYSSIFICICEKFIYLFSNNSIWEKLAL